MADQTTSESVSYTKQQLIDNTYKHRYTVANLERQIVKRGWGYESNPQPFLLLQKAKSLIAFLAGNVFITYERNWKRNHGKGLEKVHQLVKKTFDEIDELRTMIEEALTASTSQT